MSDEVKCAVEQNGQTCGRVVEVGRGGRVGEKPEDALCAMHLARLRRKHPRANDPGTLHTGNKTERITIWLSRQALKQLERAARKSGLPISTWAAQVLAEKAQ